MSAAEGLAISIMLALMNVSFLVLCRRTEKLEDRERLRQTQEYIDESER